MLASNYLAIIPRGRRLTVFNRLNATKRTFVGVFGAITFLWIIAASLFFLGRECSPNLPSDSVSHSVKSFAYGDINAFPEGVQRPITEFIFSDNSDRGYPNVMRVETTNYTHQYDSGFWDRFFCEINGADYSLALFTFLLFVSTGLLWWVTERTLAHAKDVAAAQLRPYVSVSPRDLNNFGISLPIGARCMLTNHGNVPAFKINHLVDIAILPDPLPFSYEYPHPRISLTVNMCIFPGHEAPMWFQGSRSLNFFEEFAIMSGSHRIHIWGLTSYEYTGMQTPRTTSFAFSVGGGDFRQHIVAKRLGESPPNFTWNVSSMHNGAD